MSEFTCSSANVICLRARMDTTFFNFSARHSGNELRRVEFTNIPHPNCCKLFKTEICGGRWGIKLAANLKSHILH